MSGNKKKKVNDFSCQINEVFLREIKDRRKGITLGILEHHQHLDDIMDIKRNVSQDISAAW